MVYLTYVKYRHTMAYCHTSYKNHKHYTVIKSPFSTHKNTFDLTKRIILKGKCLALKMNGLYINTPYMHPIPIINAYIHYRPIYNY